MDKGNDWEEKKDLKPPSGPSSWRAADRSPAFKITFIFKYIY
jgi:hypothetical protein